MSYIFWTITVMIVFVSLVMAVIDGLVQQVFVMTALLVVLCMCQYGYERTYSTTRQPPDVYVVELEHVAFPVYIRE